MRARVRIALLAGCVLALLSASRAAAVGLQPIGTFNSPIYITSPPGDPRLFVVERGGTIQVLHDGVRTQFLDIHTMTTNDGERGLLSTRARPRTRGAPAPPPPRRARAARSARSTVRERRRSARESAA